MRPHGSAQKHPVRHRESIVLSFFLSSIPFFLFFNFLLFTFLLWNKEKTERDLDTDRHSAKNLFLLDHSRPLRRAERGGGSDLAS